MSKKKVSVVVPVYNVEKFIDKCLNSLVNQTISDLEIVIVNDGSPDNSEEIIKGYLKKYPDMIKYIKIPNGGVANARNVGIDNSTGEYIGFCDSDDYAEENQYELLYEKAKDTKADMVVSGYFSDNEKTGTISNNGLDNLSEFSKSLEENPGMLFVMNPFITSKLYSRKMLDKYNIRFNKKYRIFEDLLFCYSALLKANKVEKVNKALYHYIRRANESVTGQLNNKFYDLYPVMYDLKDFYEKNSKVDFTEYLTYIAIHHAYLRFSPNFGLKKLGLKYRYIRDSFKFLDDFNPNWRNNIYFDLKKRKNKMYKTKLFWLVAPYGKKIISFTRKLIKKTVFNYGSLLIKYSKKPINEKAMFFESQKGNDINGNMFYLIKAVRNDSKYDNYTINVAVNKNRVQEFEKKFAFYNITNYNLVIINSKKYIKHLACDKYLFTDTSFPIYFKKRSEQVYLNTWHGTPLKYLGRSVAYDYYNISNVMNNFLMADYILYPNKFMKEAMVKDYMLDIRNNNILMLGYPRSSIFFEKTETNSKQRIAYLPTWRGTMTNIGGNSYVNELEGILNDIDKSLNDNQEFYINLHPYLKGKLDVSKYEKIKLVPKEYETYDFLNTCDILVTDYSSVFFDFANTKKKIILFTYDKEAYLKDRGMYLNIDDLPFTKVYTVKELIDEINNKKSINYKSFIDEYCHYDSKDVPQKILSLVVENNKKNVELIPNSKKVSSILIEANSYLVYDTAKELKEYLNKYNSDKKEIYLGFSNNEVSKNKEYLNEFGRKINYYGYYGFFEMVSIWELLLNQLLKKNKKLYKLFKKRYNSIFSNELERRYGSVEFNDLLLYKEKNILNIYLYSYMNCNKVIVLDKIPNINLDILNKYNKIVLENEKDKIYLSKYISSDKLYMIDNFNLDKFI